MNYKIIEILKGLRFSLDNSFLAVVESNDNLAIYVNNNKKDFKINSTEFVGRFNNNFTVKDYEGTGYILNLDTFSLNKINDYEIKFYDSNHYNLFPIYRSQSIFDPIENGVYDFQSDSVKFISKDCKSTKVIDNFYLGFFNEVLFSNSLNTGEEIWQFSLSQLSTYITDENEKKHSELVSIIGACQNILWLLVTDRRFIGLNLDTGELFHEINICEELNLQFKTVENYSFSLGDIHLDQEKGIIKGFAHRYYWELDLNNLQAEIKVDFGEGKSWRIKKSKFYKEDKNLYFTGARSGEAFDRAIGIFDTEKLEITWYDEPLGERRYLFFTDIQANDKLLGALDSEQNLRIYER